MRGMTSKQFVPVCFAFCALLWILLGLKNIVKMSDEISILERYLQGVPSGSKGLSIPFKKVVTPKSRIKPIAWIAGEQMDVSNQQRNISMVLYPCCIAVNRLTIRIPLRSIHTMRKWKLKFLCCLSFFLWSFSLSSPLFACCEHP